MIEFILAPDFVRVGIKATDPHGLPVDVKKGYKYAISDDGQAIGPYNYTRRLNGKGEVDLDSVTPLLEALGGKYNVVGRATLEIRAAEVSLNAHGVEEWAFLNRSKWPDLGFKPPKGWATYTNKQNYEPNGHSAILEP